MANFNIAANLYHIRFVKFIIVILIFYITTLPLFNVQVRKLLIIVRISYKPSRNFLRLMIL